MKTAPYLAIASAILGAVFFALPVSAYTAGTFTIATDGTMDITGLTNATAGRGIGETQSWGGSFGATTSVPQWPSNLGVAWGVGPNVWTNDFGCTVISATEVSCPTILANGFSLTGANFVPPVVPVGNYELIIKDSTYTGGALFYYDVYFDGVNWWAGTVNVQTIDFSKLYFPAVYSTSSAAITASSSLWGAFASSSQLIQTCNSGNIFGDAICQAFSFLFVPNPNVLNSFVSLPSVAATKFPFSWIYGVKDEFSSLAVASTTAMTSLSYNFHNLGIGSTTPMGNIMPNFEVFSKNTIETYISPTLWNTFQTLIAAGMWLAFVWYEFNRARHMAKPTHV